MDVTEITVTVCRVTVGLSAQDLILTHLRYLLLVYVSLSSPFSCTRERVLQRRFVCRFRAFLLRVPLSYFVELFVVLLKWKFYVCCAVLNLLSI